MRAGIRWLSHTWQPQAGVQQGHLRDHSGGACPEGAGASEGAQWQVLACGGRVYLGGC